MDNRQELKRTYLERKKPAGVFQVKNLVSGKVLLGSSLNLEGPLNAHRFTLQTGTHRNEELQRDYDALGADAFVFEILEEVKQRDDERFNLEEELAFLEELWSEKIDPFDGRGYNRDRKIRQA